MSVQEKKDALSREEFFGVTKPMRKSVWVPLPHLGDGKGVFVRMMGAKDRDDFESDMIGKNQKERLVNIRAKLVGLTACTEDGERLFSNADILELGERDHETIEVIFEKAKELNRIFLSDNQEEQLAKN